MAWASAPVSLPDRLLTQQDNVTDDDLDSADKERLAPAPHRHLDATLALLRQRPELQLLVVVVCRSD